MGKRKRRPVNRNWDNPAIPLTLEEPDDAVLDLFGSTAASSGVRVNRKKALGYTAVWRAVNLISGDVAKLPLGVYRLNGRNRELDKLHPSYRLLVRKPNPWMTPFVLKQTLIGHVLTEGNAYAFIDRLPDGTPIGLYVMDPDKVTPIRVDGRLWYVYGRKTDRVDQMDKIPSDDVIHIRGLGFDGLQGYPVIKYHVESLGTAIAARDFGGRYFKNDARPGGVLKHPGKLGDVARKNMRESWERLHTGLSNKHRIAILEEGTDYVSFNSNAKDAQLLENREFDSREVANIFGVPTHKLGDPSKVAYNSLEQENQSYYDDTLARWLRVTAEECHDKLLTEDEKDRESHLIDFDYQEIKRADVNAQVAFVTSLTEKGIITIDEGRAILGMNSQADTAAPDVDPDLQPRSVVPAPVPSVVVPVNGLRAVLLDTVTRMVTRVAKHARKAGSSDTWRSMAMTAHREVIAEALSPALLACRECGLGDHDAGELAVQIVGNISDAIEGLDGSQVEQIADQIERHAPKQIVEKIMGVSNG